MRPDVCIYHGNCADGFGAAWVVWKKFGNAVVFEPGVYGKAPPDVAGKNVAMVDFSYKRPVLEQMQKVAKGILILDHHKTAAADLADIERHPLDFGLDCVTEVVFDMERSGAQITWDYYFKGLARPILIDYVGDRDLWRFKMPNSRAVAAWVFSHAYRFVTWEEMDRQISSASYYQGVVDQGEAIERKHHKDIDELLDQSLRYMTIGGHRIPVANLPYTMASDAAGKLAEGNAFAACYFDRADARVFSLRSRAPDGTDVSEIAKRYGGGGHKNAAGFQVVIGWEGESPEIR